MKEKSDRYGAAKGLPGTGTPTLRVVQRVAEYRIHQPRFYYNMNPSAAVNVDRSNIVKLEHFSESYRLRRPGQHGLLVPNAKYVFVRMTTGEIRMHPQYRHPVLAEGKPVLYAGEAYFSNGSLDWWSNGSGNYRPDPDHALQADLPMERFFTYEEIIRGKQRNRV